MPANVKIMTGLALALVIGVGAQAGNSNGRGSVIPAYYDAELFNIQVRGIPARR
jgi:hypothetical protein